MKRTLISFPLMAALLWLAASCSDDCAVSGTDAAPADADTVTRQGPALHIGVTSAGFARATEERELSGSRLTRTLPEGSDADDDIYRATVFEMNDTVGIFAVDATGKVTVFNAKFTFDGQNWGGSKVIDYVEGYEYFCYSPYQPDSVIATAPQQNAQVGSGKSAEQFFAAMIAGWDIKTDQQSYQNYKLSDLMVGKGVPDADRENTMLFRITHQHGLAVLNLGYVKKILKSGTYYWFEPATNSFKAACDTTDARNYVPTFVHGQFRCLVPAETSFSITASDDEWMINDKVFEKGYCQVYGIGYDEKNPRGGWSYHDLQVGDIMYSDGSLLHYNETTKGLVAQRAAEAIGYVVYVANGSAASQRVIDDSTDENGAYDSPYQNGLVHALTPISNWKLWIPDEYLLDNENRLYFTTPYNGTYHYSGLKMTRNYERIDEAYFADSLVHINDAMEQLHGRPYPTGSTTPNSGWFFPALGQIYESAYAIATALGDETCIGKVTRAKITNDLSSNRTGDYSLMPPYSSFSTGMSMQGYLAYRAVNGANALRNDYFGGGGSYGSITPYAMTTGRPTSGFTYGQSGTWNMTWSTISSTGTCYIFPMLAF